VQQLIQLRRMILARKGARLNYLYDGHRNSLSYGESGFLGSLPTVASKLREAFFADDLKISEFVSASDDSSKVTSIPAVNAVVSSLRGLQLDETTQQDILNIANKLPPLDVKFIALSKAGFEDSIAYIQLHQDFLQKGSIDMSAYLTGGPPGSQLRRSRVFIAVFLLGLISKRREVQSSNPVVAESTSRLTRIMQRIREL